MPPQEYYVYVIGLKPEVLKSQRFRDANPDYQDGQPCYYVGYSSKQPEVRALEHRDAARNNRGRLYSTIAHRYYNGLRPRKFKHLNPFQSQEEAMEAEEQLALRLRRKGFGVWWN